MVINIRILVIKPSKYHPKADPSSQLYLVVLSLLLAWWWWWWWQQSTDKSSSFSADHDSGGVRSTKKVTLI